MLYDSQAVFFVFLLVCLFLHIYDFYVGSFFLLLFFCFFIYAVSTFASFSTIVFIELLVHLGLPFFLYMCGSSSTVVGNGGGYVSGARRNDKSDVKVSVFFCVFLPFSFALSSLTLNSSPKLIVYPSIYKEKCGTNYDECAILYYYYYVCFVYLFSF